MLWDAVSATEPVAVIERGCMGAADGMEQPNRIRVAQRTENTRKYPCAAAIRPGAAIDSVLRMRVNGLI